MLRDATREDCRLSTDVARNCAPTDLGIPSRDPGWQAGRTNIITNCKILCDIIL